MTAREQSRYFDFRSRMVLVTIAVVFAIHKSFALDYSVGDENICFYLAEAMSRGELPYRDFFHAHPPLHLLPLALIYKGIGGFSLFPARLLSGCAIVLAALLIARGQRRPAAAAGLIGCAILLNSFDVLRISTHYVGSNLAAFWVALGLERLRRERDLQAALAFSLGGFTLHAAAPAAVGAALIVALVDPARGLRLAAAGVLITLALNGAAAGFFGSAYLDQVYWFHLLKSATAGESLEVVVSVAQANSLLLGASGLGIVALILGRESEPADSEASGAPGLRAEVSAQLPLYAALGAGLASILFLAASSRIFIYYFQVLFVCLAPVAGHGVVALWQSLAAAFAKAPVDRPERREAQIASVILLFVFVGSQLPGWLPSRDPNPTTTSHDWRGSGVGLIDRAVKWTLWRELETVGHPTLGVTRYLWHEADYFASADLLAREVARRCGPEETLFGDSTATPLVALLAGRRLALGEADTNAQRMARGESASVFLEALNSDPPCAVLFRSRHGLFQLVVFRDWLHQHYRRVLEADNAIASRHFELYVRRNASDPT